MMLGMMITAFVVVLILGGLAGALNADCARQEAKVADLRRTLMGLRAVAKTRDRTAEYMQGEVARARADRKAAEDDSASYAARAANAEHELFALRSEVSSLRETLDGIWDLVVGAAPTKAIQAAMAESYADDEAAIAEMPDLPWPGNEGLRAERCVDR